MLKILALCAILAFVNSEEQYDKTVQVMLTNYNYYKGMYDSECKSTTSAPAQSSGTTYRPLFHYAAFISSEPSHFIFVCYPRTQSIYKINIKQTMRVQVMIIKMKLQVNLNMIMILIITKM